MATATNNEKNGNTNTIKIISIVASVLIATATFLGGLAVAGARHDERITTNYRRISDHEEVCESQYEVLVQKIDEQAKIIGIMSTDIAVIKRELEDKK